MDDNEFFRAARRELDKRAIDPSPPYWDDEDDRHNTYCANCASKRNGNFIPAGFYPEEDGVTVCDECGTLLRYVLTDYGVTNELEHFLDTNTASWDWNTPDHCYEVGAILGGVIGDGWFDANEIDAALRRDLLALLRKGKNAPVFTSEEA